MNIGLGKLLQRLFQTRQSRRVEVALLIEMKQQWQFQLRRRRRRSSCCADRRCARPACARRIPSRPRSTYCLSMSTRPVQAAAIAGARIDRAKWNQPVAMRLRFLQHEVRGERIAGRLGRDQRQHHGLRDLVVVHPLEQFRSAESGSRAVPSLAQMRVHVDVFAGRKRVRGAAADATATSSSPRPPGPCGRTMRRDHELQCSASATAGLLSQCVEQIGQQIGHGVPARSLSPDLRA